MKGKENARSSHEKYKLYFEDVPQAKNYKSAPPQKPSLLTVLVGYSRTGFGVLWRFVVQFLKALYRSAILNVDDNKTMQKMPPANKTNARNKRR